MKTNDNDILVAQLESLATRNSKPETYNGWKNYETWNCKLWMDNDEFTQSTIYSQASDLSTEEFAEWIQEFHEMQMPEVEGWARDLLMSAIENVDWYEIAEAIKETVEENEGDE